MLGWTLLVRYASIPIAPWYSQSYFLELFKDPCSNKASQLGWASHLFYQFFDSKEGCYSLNQKRLRKFECVSINLLDVHSKMFIDWPFVLQHKMFISSMKWFNQCIDLLHWVTINDAIIHICEYDESLTKKDTRINTAWNKADCNLPASNRRESCLVAGHSASDFNCLGHQILKIISWILGFLNQPVGTQEQNLYSLNTDHESLPLQEGCKCLPSYQLEHTFPNNFFPMFACHHAHISMLCVYSMFHLNITCT